MKKKKKIVWLVVHQWPRSRKSPWANVPPTIMPREHETKEAAQAWAEALQRVETEPGHKYTATCFSPVH